MFVSPVKVVVELETRLSIRIASEYQGKGTAIAKLVGIPQSSKE
jgi:hypothetical protein